MFYTTTEKTSMTQASPTPWRDQVISSSNPDYDSTRIVGLRDATGAVVCEFGDTERAVADAAYTRTAVNCHDELLEALQEIADHVGLPSGISTQSLRSFRDIARDAIAKATQEQTPTDKTPQSELVQAVQLIEIGIRRIMADLGVDDMWASHETYCRKDWCREAGDNDTHLGYWHGVANKILEKECET